MSGPRVVARSRVAAGVLAVLLVTVAAIGYRLSDPDSDYQLVRAPLGQPTRYQSGLVRVSDVRVASQLQRGEDHYETAGLFVVLNVSAQAGGRDAVDVGDERLLSTSGAVYLPAFSLGDVVRAEPGFQTSRDIVFEVDPHQIDGLVVELWTSGFVYRYYERTQTPLGITAANASAWAEAGAGRLETVSDRDVTQALP